MKLKIILHYIGLQIVGYLGLFIGLRLRPEHFPIPTVPSVADSALIYYIEAHGFFIAAILATFFVIGAAKILKKSILVVFCSIMFTGIFPFFYCYMGFSQWPFFSFVSCWGYLIGVVFAIGLFCLLENIVVLCKSQLRNKS